MIDPRVLAEIEAHIQPRLEGMLGDRFERRLMDGVIKKLRDEILDYQIFKLAEIEQRLRRLEGESNAAKG